MGESTFFGLPVSVPVPVDLGIVAVLTLVAGIMAGLILCVFSMDVTRLNGLLHGPNVHEALQARRVLRIVEHPHWLLVTLLVWNDIALEMMPLILNMFLHPLVAVIVSVAITLFFCEIIPQATFIHHAFALSAFFAPLVYVLMWVTAPVAWPIGKLLDYVVGDKEAVFFQRRELRELIRFQEQLRDEKRQRTGVTEEGGTRGETSENEEEEDLTKEEVTIMLNILSLSENTAESMLQASNVVFYKLHVDTVITRSIVETIFLNGYTFVPVYEDANDAANVTAVLMTKVLALLIYRHQDEGIRVKDLPLMPLQRFNGTMLGSEVFVSLQRMSPPIAAIMDDATGSVLGVLTLKNVIEQIHQASFSAEMDPRNQNPLQVMMRSWKVVRRIVDNSVELSSSSASFRANNDVRSPFSPRGPGGTMRPVVEPEQGER